MNRLLHLVNNFSNTAFITAISIGLRWLPRSSVAISTAMCAPLFVFFLSTCFCFYVLGFVFMLLLVVFCCFFCEIYLYSYFSVHTLIRTKEVNALFNDLLNTLFFFNRKYNVECVVN